MPFRSDYLLDHQNYNLKSSHKSYLEKLHPMLCNSASGQAGLRPDFDRENRPSAGRKADFEALPIRIRPKSGPEARFPARKH